MRVIAAAAPRERGARGQHCWQIDGAAGRLPPTRLYSSVNTAAAAAAVAA